jgi:hypothetical protein
MYVSEHNPTLSLAVWVFDNATPEEWAKHFDDLADLATWSGKNQLRAAALMIPKTFEVPGPELRTRLTELTSRPGYDPYVAFVAPNKALQTVLTLFSWFQKKPQYETKFVSSVEDGILWLEEKRGTKLTALRLMSEDALRRASGGTKAAG